MSFAVEIRVYGVFTRDDTQSAEQGRAGGRLEAGATNDRVLPGERRPAQTAAATRANLARLKPGTYGRGT